KAPGAIEQLVAATAARDGRAVAIRIEQEPGASGKALGERYQRHVRGRHRDDFLDELTAFPHGAHDDCVDALAGAYDYLRHSGRAAFTTHVPRGRIPLGSYGGRDTTLFHGGDPLVELAARLGAGRYPVRPR